MNNKSIFDTLPTMPDGAQAAGHADTGRIRELVHKGLEEQKTLHHSKKRRRFLPLFVAAVALISISLIGGTILACAMNGVSEEDEMQQKLTEEFNVRVKELVRNDPEEKIYMFPSTKIEFQAVSEERKKVCDIVNKYRDNKYEDYYAYYVKDYEDYPTVEDHFVFFRFIIDLCDVYRTEELTTEEKMRILNYMEEINCEMKTGFTPNAEQMTNYNIEKRYPEEYLLWGKAWNPVIEILKEYDFENKYSWGYLYETSKYSCLSKQQNSIENHESSNNDSDPYASN